MRYFFSGIAGAGMNPLAQLMRAWGHEVSGSDRGFDQGKEPELRARLLAQGIRLVPQDGRGLPAGLEKFVYSAAVERDTPEMVAARALPGIQLLPRPLLLAGLVSAADPGVAVAGTSGKSTVTGMIAWILRQASRPANILGGAALAGEGVAGGFAAGPMGGLLVAESCESDGTLVEYEPAIGLVHNITRDHGELDGLRQQFATFARRSSHLVANAGCVEARALAAAHPHAFTYDATTPGRPPLPGISPAPAPEGRRADLILEIVSAGPDRARGVLALRDGVEADLDLPQPGAHNLENAAAAVAVALQLGVPLARAAAALASFPGVARRFEVIGTTDTGIRVVDDYAHNGDKLRAAITAAQDGCDRLIAIFQPHGYGPARFLRPELREMLPRLLRPQDRFCYAGIYYAGGTVAKDISSADLAGDLPPALRCGHAPDHPAVLQWAADQAMPGDTVLLMGARDPALPGLARALHELL
jgi:UDP-N-acetylmuramate--alanine ligase